MTYYVLHDNGQRYGPTDVATLEQWMREGRVSPTTQLEEIETGRRFMARELPTLYAGRPADSAGGGWTQPPSGSYNNPYPRYNQPAGGDGSKEVTMAWIFGSLGILCCPVIFSTVGIVMGYQAKQRGNPGGQAAMIFSICTLVLGIAIGVILQLSGNSVLDRLR